MSGSELLAGAAIVLSSTLALAAAIGLLVSAGPRPPAGLLVAAAALGMAGAWWMPPEAAHWAAVVLVACGAAAVLNLRVPRVFAALLAFAGGLAAGLAADFHWATPLEALGGMGAFLLPLGAGAVLLHATDRRAHWRGGSALALRVMGAWVLVLGVLMLALAGSSEVPAR